jgi:hypothetical protein
MVQHIQPVFKFSLKLALTLEFLLAFFDHFDRVSLFLFTSHQNLGLRQKTFLTFHEDRFTMTFELFVPPNLGTRIINKLPIPRVFTRHAMRVISSIDKVGLHTLTTGNKIAERAFDLFAISAIESFAAHITITHLVR